MPNRKLPDIHYKLLEINVYEKYIKLVKTALKIEEWCPLRFGFLCRTTKIKLFRAFYYYYH